MEDEEKEEGGKWGRGREEAGGHIQPHFSLCCSCREACTAACRVPVPRAPHWVALPSYHQAPQVHPTVSDLPACGVSRPNPKSGSGRVGVLTRSPFIQPLPSALRLQPGRRSSGTPAALALATNEGRCRPRPASVSCAPSSGPERDSPGSG